MNARTAHREVADNHPARDAIRDIPAGGENGL